MMKRAGLLWPLPAVAGWLLAVGSAGAEERVDPTAVATPPAVTAVVELFTSQGCSSCPPADHLLSTYAERPDTLALAWHVDYWNYLGWRDTFSRAAHSDRQRGYAQRMESGVFTPQVVVNGSAQAVGSRGPDVARLTRDARSMPLLPLRVVRDGGRIGVTLSGTAAERARAEGAVLTLVRYERVARVVIDRGENRGRAITYRNVVRTVEPVARVIGGRMRAELTIAMPRGEGCALMLQAAGDDGPGPILAAAVLE